MQTVASTGSLTKAFLMSLREGAYVVSNVCDPWKKPLYAASVAPIQGRNAQWQDIKRSNASGRLCHVFNNESDYKEVQAVLRKKGRVNQEMKAQQSVKFLEELLEDSPEEVATETRCNHPHEDQHNSSIADTEINKSEQPTIREIVLNDERYQRIIRELLEKRFLVPGVFHPQAYLRDTDKIKQAWMHDKTKLNAIAMGVSLQNEFFQDIMNCCRNFKNPSPSRQTKKALAAWESDVKRLFASEFNDIEETCGKLGQYLEFMSRKAQEF